MASRSTPGRSPIGVAALLLVLVLPAAAAAADRYFLLVFGAERPSSRAKYSHSFATFVKASGQGADPQTYPLECATISWIPGTGIVKVSRLMPEPGRNLDLTESLQSALGEQMKVSMWGPFAIDAELYADAVRREATLESGMVRYKAVDTAYRRERVFNCIHAISDLETRGPRLRIGRPSWGASASYFITLSLLPWTIEPRLTHDWVATRLGLDDYPIIRRDLYHNPSSHALLRALQNSAHCKVRKNIPE